MRISLSRHAAAAALLVFAILVALGQPLAARPEYLTRYQSDPMRRAEIDGCATCHVAQTGGGARNEFGRAFEAALLQFTPLLRASHPQYFKFDSIKLADGGVLSFSDPTSKLVVVERKDQRFAAELAALTAVRAAPPPPAANRMTFFVTSQAPASFDRFGGLAGADRHCYALAKSVGADDRVWRAYLSTSVGDKAAVNAGDRIGPGPWYNAKGMIVARGAADLHARPTLPPELLLSEKGEPIATAKERVTIVTGTLANGTAAVGKNCQNWTAAEGGEAVAANPLSTWNSGITVSCNASSEQPAAPRLYCFAAK